MTSLLRRSKAPLTDQAWEVVDSQAAQILKTQLSARRFVDIDGPHGWKLAAVDTGRLDLPDSDEGQEVPWGIRKVLPLLELRLPFVLKQMELDAISRGSKDPDLAPLQEAAKKAAEFEESVIYQGLEAAQVRGILQAPQRAEVPLPDDPLEYPNAVAKALKMLQVAGLPGPFAMVLGRTPYFELMQQGCSNYPLHRLVEEQIGGPILPSSAVPGGLVISVGSGHFELTLGQDWSVGYASHDRDEIELYLTESFMFRVLEPEAVVGLTAGE
jgi:uncharacterized linocin/CFP29 family protein